MKKNLFLFVLLGVFALTVFQSCEEDVDSHYGIYPVSWMPVTDLEGNNLKPAYTEGNSMRLLVKFKNFESNPVSKITLYAAKVDEVTGKPGTKELVKDYAAADFKYIEAELQYKVEMEYTIEVGKYTDQKVQLSAVFQTSKGDDQDRELAVFSVSEYFPFIVEGVRYSYMYDNAYEDAGMGYTVEHSAGYTALVTVMNHYGFDPDNANFQGELGGNVLAHTPDWVSSYYVSVWPGYLAQDVYELHQTYHYEAPYYGGVKLLKSTELGTYEAIDAAIENGQMVIVHGDFRGDVAYKHQIILVAQNENSFLALDPAGKWNGQKNGDYTKNATAGVYVKYSKEAVYAAIGENGSVWMHVPVDEADELLELAE